MTLAGYQIHHRFFYSTRDSKGERHEFWSQWEDYWNHKIYSEKSGTEAMKYIQEKNIFMKHELKLVPVYYA